MIDAKKVRLMTKIAVYEEGIGREDLAINKNTRRTYMTVQMAKSFLCLSLAAFLLILLYSFRYFSSGSGTGVTADPRQILIRALAFYLAVLAVGMIMCWRYYRKRYNDMLVRMKQYDRNLSRLSRHIAETGKD